MSQQLDFRTRYIERLQSFVDQENRAALAALRRGLTTDDGIAPEMHRYVVPWLPEVPRAREDRLLYQTAALFAWHQGWWRGDSESDDRHRYQDFGASCAWLARTLGRESFEKRFVALLDSHPDDVYPRLRAMVGLLRSGGIPIDWPRLLADIQGWGHESRYVQRRWARSFWNAGSGRREDEP